jgi:TonB family protein
VATLPKRQEEPSNEEDRSPAREASSTPTVRVKVTLDDNGRVEGAYVVDSPGDDRLEEAVIREVRGRQFGRPLSEGRGGARVAYATFEVVDRNQPRFLHAESRSR